MVTKRVKFRGSALADRLGTQNNFICNDENNLLFNPTVGSGTQQGIAENRFRVAETIAPAWSKISVGYKKTAVYGSHDGTIEVYGLDNLGLETLLYQTKINLTETGTQNQSFIDMLRSSCTGAITRADNINTIRNHMEIRMPKLREKYDDVSLQAAWYNSAWTKRKGVPINLSLNAKHGQTIYTDDTAKDGAWTVPSAYKDDYWYEVIKVTYDADMQADFGDLRFTGFDGVSPIEYWIISKTDSSTATVMLRIPWYWGWNELDKPQEYTNFGTSSGTSEVCNQLKHCNTEPKYIWMYYGNATCANGTKTPVSGEDGVYYFDDFTTDTTSEWTNLGTGANSTVGWDTSSSLDMQINANNTNAGMYTYHALPDEISGTYASYDIIWKLENIPTTSGNYDAAVWVGTGSSSPSTYLALWISATDVYAVQSKAGVVTTWTAGGLSFNHDDTKPLYIRARIHPDHESQGAAGITWEISKDCRIWNQVVHLKYTTDISVIPYSELTHFGMRMSAWAAAPAFNMELDTDWIMITESHKIPGRGYEFTDHFEFSDINYMWNGYNSEAANGWSFDYATSQIGLAITSGSQIYSAGTDTAARIEIQTLYPIDAFVMETKLDSHTRTSGNLTMATMYAGTDANKHFNICHQLYTTAQYDQQIRCWSTYGGSDYLKTEQEYQKEPISEGPIWMRIIVDPTTNRIMGQYSRDGYNWYNCGIDTWSSFNDITDFGFVLQNGGGGNGTAKWDYFRTVVGPYAANWGDAFTAEQAYSDYADIAPDSTIYYEYNDDFEDNKYTARTWPYRDYTSQGGTPSVITNSLGAELLAENQSTFETGVSLTAGNATITQSNTVAQTGTYSAKIVGTADDSYGAPGGDYDGTNFRLGMGANKIYYLHGYVYSTDSSMIEDASGGNQYRKGRVCLFYKDAGGNLREVQSEGIKAVNTWNEIKFRFRIPSGATAAALRYYCGSNGKTVYFDNMSLKEGEIPISETYSLKHIGATSDTSASVITFEQPYKAYTTTFKWTPVYDGWGSSSSSYNRLWILRSANDPDSYTAVDLVYSAGTIVGRVVSYDNRSGTAVATGTFRAGNGNLPQKEYDITIHDNGNYVSVWIDSVNLFFNTLYGTATNVSKVLPATHSGFGANYNNFSYWDDIRVRPGIWYNGIQYSDTGLTTPVTTKNTSTSTVIDPENSYYFRMPTTFIRNQPMKLAWKEQGQTTEWQYSKPFYPRDGGVFSCGPNGLDKYIGMKTKILFTGDSDDDFEVTDISYEYEV